MAWLCGGSVICLTTSAATLHVWPDSPSPYPPYAEWATAAHTIQDAVDAAQPADTVLVTNGVYATGGQSLGNGFISNRVFINKAITVESINGPAVTIIEGAPASTGGNGSNAIRCAFLGTNAVLSGFTLTNGHSALDYGPPSSLWWYGDTEAGGVVAAPSATLSNCVIEGNSGLSGGGAAWGTLLHCTLMRNQAEYGGASYNATLSNCTLTANSAELGGGSGGGMLFNCTLTDNQAERLGGGSFGSTLTNCVLTGNRSGDKGGGTFSSSLYQCTLTGNQAGREGGGIHRSGAFNCIVYFNRAPLGANYFEETMRYSCSSPLPSSGMGNISDDPQLASTTHLSVSSPCIGAGSAEYASGVDIDGEPWSTPPSMGADEFVAGGVVGPLSVAITADSTNVAAGFGVSFTARIEGRTTGSQWNMGDGTVLDNQPNVEFYSWSEAGSYEVQLTAFNETYPSGVSATITVQVVEQPVLYVNQANPNPTFPYTSWETAATNIQDAINASSVAGRQVWVTNGVYDVGGMAVWGTMTNRVALTHSVTVQSVNGPAVTLIQGVSAPTGTSGDGAIRCAYVGQNSVLSGFTLTNGHTRATGDTGRDQSGAGAWCESGGILTNCILIGNHAFRDGGGADGGTLFNCTLTGNSAGDDGGGTDDAVLYHCTVRANTAGDNGGGADEGILYDCIIAGNSALHGGGVDDSTLYNCTVADNTAALNAGGASDSTLYNCVLTGNAASQNGGGTVSGNLYHCTVTANVAGWQGGGIHGSFMFNCIAYHNRAFMDSNWYWDPNRYTYYSETLHQPPVIYSCTTPLPTGDGNLAEDPQLASSTHLAATSPCIAAGSATFTSGVDIDGESWLAPPSMGADEFVPGSAIGPLSVAISAEYTTVVAGVTVNFGARIEGRAATSQWDLEDGTVVSNRPGISQVWQELGIHTVRFAAFNESHPEGVSSTVTVQVVAQPVSYVDQANPNPVFPYDSWETAAHTIQEAIDASNVPGRLVMVTDGIYSTGGRAVWGLLTNRIVLNHSVTVQSVNGPLATIIRGSASPSGTNGDGAVRCAYVGDGSMLSGFTVAQGFTRAAGDYSLERSGAGAWCQGSGGLTNCVLTGNHAKSNGGGAAGGTFWDCLLIGNTAVGGGGVYEGVLWNCVLIDNSALEGGGALECTLRDCWLSDNWATYRGGGVSQCTVHDSTLQFNSSDWGGGAEGSTLHNCRLLSNSATWEGGGADESSLYDCELSGNSAGSRGGGVADCEVHDSVLELNTAAEGGGARRGKLYNCTIISNSATGDGGGADGSQLFHCVLTGNLAGRGGGVAGCEVHDSVLELNTAAEGGGARRGMLYNCKIISNSATSDGGGADGSQLFHCVLTGNSASKGGGAKNSTLYDCTLSANSASINGGGTKNGTLQRCRLTGNTASGNGGGSHESNADDCVFHGNSAATDGGGAFRGLLRNCTLVDNSAGDDGGGADESSLRNCILFTNSPTSATASTLLTCWTNGDPVFVDYVAGNLRLQSNSPCINIGDNAQAGGGTDLDGLRRIADGVVDLGAYEFQSPAMLLFDAWLQQFGLPIDGSADTEDSDGDLLNNWQEWRCRTDPTNALSVLRLLTAIPTETEVTVSWQSVAGVGYFLECSTNLSSSPAFLPLATNVIGQAGTTTFTDTNVPPARPAFYRVGVLAP